MNEFKNIIKNFLDNHLLVYLDKILNKPNLDNGLIEETAKQIKKAGHYVYGLLGETNSRPMKEDGDFTDFLPVGEQQNTGFERMWCVSENGICNSIETDFNYYISLVNQGKADKDTQELVKIFKHFGLIVGDKCLLETPYVASGSGTTRRGLLYSKAGYFVRKNGLVPKGSYPAYSSWNGLYYPANGTWINGNKVPTDLLNKGRKLVEFIDITYEWVNPKNYNETASMGSQGSSCFAWMFPDKNGIYQRVNLARNHSILRFKKNDTDHKKISDSYQPFVKKLALNYSLGSGFLLSYGIKKKLPNFREQLIEDGYDYVLRAETEKGGRGEVYDVKSDKLYYVNKDEWNKRAVQAKTIERKIKFITEDFFRKLS